MNQVVGPVQLDHFVAPEAPICDESLDRVDRRGQQGVIDRVWRGEDGRPAVPLDHTAIMAATVARLSFD
jgi:hypothetical protein